MKATNRIILAALVMLICLVPQFAVGETDLLSEYLAGQPDASWEADFAQGVLKRLREQFHASLITRVQEEIQRNPQNARAHFFLAVLLSEAKKEKESKESLQRAVSLSPEYAAMMKGGRTKRTMADLRAFATAVEAFAVDNNDYPGGSLPELQKMLEPLYIRTLPIQDGWGNPIVYLRSKDKQSYWIISYGADGKEDANVYTNGIPTSGLGPTNDPNNDIIFSDGSFIRFPEGAQ